MKTKILATSLLAILCISCSKKTPDATTEKKASTSETPKAPNSDDCFKLELNKQFNLNDHDRTDIQIVPTTFGDKKAIAIVKQAVGVKLASIYDETGRTELAEQSYGVEALGTDPNTVVSVTNYNAPLPSYPSNLKPNQKFKITYDAVSTNTKDNEESKSNVSFDVTFVGFENLIFVDDSDKKLEFKNVCHFISSVSKDTKDTPLLDGTTETWFAEGFGAIKTLIKTKDGEIFSNDAIGNEQQ